MSGTSLALVTSSPITVNPNDPGGVGGGTSQPHPDVKDMKDDAQNIVDGCGDTKNGKVNGNRTMRSSCPSFEVVSNCL